MKRNSSDTHLHQTYLAETSDCAETPFYCMIFPLLAPLEFVILFYQFFFVFLLAIFSALALTFYFLKKSWHLHLYQSHHYAQRLLLIADCTLSNGNCKFYLKTVTGQQRKYIFFNIFCPKTTSLCLLFPICSFSCPSQYDFFL